MNYKNAILNDTKAFLFSDEIQVETQETNDIVKFAILVGSGKKGGLHLSADLEKQDGGIMFEVILKMLQTQLVLYAIECIKAGHQVKIPKAKVPEITDTLIHQNIAVAQKNYQEIVSTINSYDFFEKSYFKKNDNKRGRPKTKRD